MVVVAAIIGCRSAGDTTDDSAGRGAFLSTKGSSDDAANGGAGQDAGLWSGAWHQGGRHQEKGRDGRGEGGHSLAEVAAVTGLLLAHWAPPEAACSPDC